tara:strand:- start:129 stop:491 length:363 start_codon:yes stop_codon:yes gene_type:complete
MASKGTWSVIFDDKVVVKKTDDMASEPMGHRIDDDAFWSQAKFSNIWAIQYGCPNADDQVEHRDTTPHCSYAEANLGDFNDFITRFDAAHLAKLQYDWDVWEEEESVKGPRPSSYSSNPV